MPSVIFGDISSPGRVLGVHGGAGAMWWVRLATGAHLYGDWDGFEWVALEPGARAGLHTHSHTEEIWFFLEGTGTIELNGKTYEVAPGSIVLTPLNSQHAAWNTGDERLGYIVIEVFPPEISSKLPPRRPTEEPDSPPGTSPAGNTRGTPRRSGAAAGRGTAGLVTVLDPGGPPLAAADYFAGPWRDFSRVRIAPGDRTTIAGKGSESAVYVMGGSLTAQVGDTGIPLSTGGSLVVGLGSSTDLVAGPDGAELFITTLTAD